MKEILRTAIDNNTAAYLKLVNKAINLMINNISTLINSLLSNSGNIIANTNNLNYTTQLAALFTNIIRNSGYSEANALLINKYDLLLTGINKVLPKYALPIKLIGSQATDLAAFKTYISSLFDLIGKDSINKLQRLVMNGITKQQNANVLLLLLKTSLSSNLQRYSTTYANTAQRLYIQKALLLSALNIKEAGISIMYEYLGPDDSKTRWQCQHGLTQRYFTLLLMQAFESEGLRYSCRHIFIAINKKDITK